MSVKAMLEKEIETGFEKLKELEAGTNEYENTVNSIGKLIDKYNDIDRTENDYLEKSAKLDQMKEEKIDHIIKNGLSLFGTVAGIALTIWGTNKTLRFEETGTITTSAGRAFIKNLFSKR